MKSRVGGPMRCLVGVIAVICVGVVGCTQAIPLDADLGITVEGMTYDADTNTFSGQFFAGGQAIRFRGTGGKTDRATIVTLTIDSANSTIGQWAESGMTITGMVNQSRLVGYGTGSAEVAISGTPAGIYRLRGTIAVDDRVTTRTVGFDLELILSTVSIVGRRTLDLDGDGHIDTIRLTYNANLNDDLAGFVVSVAGYTVASVSTGATPNDNEIDIHLNEIAAFDTGARPSLQVIAAPNLKDDVYGVATATDPIQLVPDDGAAPVLVKAVASDGLVPGFGVDAGDTVELTFSEIVTPAQFSAADLVATFLLDNGHSWLDGTGQFGGVAFNFNKVTITLTDAGSAPTVADGDTVTMGGNLLADSAGNAAIGTYTMNPAEGSFSPRMEITSRRTMDRDSNGFIDAIELTFNLPVNDATIGTIAVEINGNPGRNPVLHSHPDGATTDDDTKVYIFFDEGTERTGDTPTVRILDFDGLTSTAAAGALAPTPDTTAHGTADGAPPVLLSAFASDGLNEVMGVDDDDFVVLTFSEAVQGTLTPEIIDAALALNNGHTWLDGLTPQLGLVEFSGTTVTIFLAANSVPSAPTIAGGDTITVGGTAIHDAAGNAAVGLLAQPVVISGTFDPTLTVTILSRTTRDTDHNGFIDAIELVFDRAINDAAFVPGDEVYLDGVLIDVADISIDTGAAANDATVLLRFPEQLPPNYDTDRTPTLRIAVWQDLRDAATGTRIFTGETTASTPGDGANPILLSATASDGTNPIIGPDGDDTVTLVFSEPIKPVTLNASNINTALPLSNGHSWLDGAGSFSGVTFVGNTLIAHLSGNPPPPTIAEGDIITPAALLEDPSGNPVWPTVTAAIGGSFSSQFGTIARRTLDTDAQRNGRIDVIELEFSANLNDAFGGMDIVVTGRTVTGISTGTAANDNKIWVHILEAIDPDTDATPTVQILDGGNLRDISDAIGIEIDANPVATTDGANPLLLEAVASDGATLAPGIDNDDTVTLRFSEPMDTTTPTLGQIQSALNAIFLLGGHTWYDTAGGVTSVQWADSRTLVITLRAQNGPPTIQPGDPISVGSAGPVVLRQQNGALNLLHAIGGLTITGHFGVGETDFWASRIPLPDGAGLSELAAASTADEIYIFGGDNAGGTTRAVLSYNIYTQVWRRHTNVPVAAYRGMAAATLDGGVTLVAGGETSGGSATAAFYGNSNGTWIPLPDLKDAAAYGSLIVANGVPFYIGGNLGSHTTFFDGSEWKVGPAPSVNARRGVAVAHEGMIFYFGGDVSGTPTDSAFLMGANDLASGWKGIANLPVPLRRPGACVLDGQIYIVGGITTGNATSTAVYAYNPQSNSYSHVTTLPTARSGIGNGVVAAAGGIYVLGGQTTAGVSSRMQTYYPTGAPNRWRRQTDMPQRRSAHGAAPLGAGAVVFGGRDNTGTVRAETFVLNANGNWSTSTALPAVRHSMGVANYAGYTLCVGGRNASALVDTVYYRLQSGEWRTADPLPSAWAAGAIVPLGADLYQIGGQTGVTSTSTVQILDFFGGSAPTARTAMNVARRYFGHAVLDGKIYVFGGINAANTVVSSAEVYDPVADTWTALPAMPDARAGTSAVVLNDEIWIVGGTSAAATPTGIRPVIVFNPQNGVYRFASNIGQNVSFAGVVKIGETALCLGGAINGTSQSSQSAERLNRNRSGDGRLTTLPAARQAISAVALGGHIYTVGGLTNAGAATNELRVYTESNSAFSTLAVLPQARAGAAVASVYGRIYAIGGGTGNNPDFDAGTNSVYEYTPASNSWATSTNLPFTAYGAVAVSCLGSVYVIGGTSQMSRLDEGSKTWMPPTSFPAPPFAVTRFSQGVAVGARIFVFGGAGAPAGAAIFDVIDHKWRRLPDMPNGHYAGAAVHLGRYIYVLGGAATAGGTAHPRVSVFDLVTETWSHGRPLPAARDRFAAAVVANDMAIIGGRLGNAGTLDVTAYLPLSERFAADVPPDYWRRLSQLTPLHHFQGALTAVNGKLVAVGGASAAAPDGGQSASVFDFATQTWATSTNTLATLTPNPAIAVDSGNVYVAGGGVIPNNAKSDFVVFDPTSRTFTPSPANNLPGAKAQLGGAMIGRLWYVAGGIDDTASNEVFVYDFVAAGAWNPRAALPAARTNGALVAIDGQLMYLGGTASGGQARPEVYVYDPQSNVWRTGRIPNLPSNRAFVAGAALGHFVYAVGGTDGTTPQPSMWVYHPWQRAWLTAADTLTDGHGSNSVVAHDGRLYRLPQAVANPVESRSVEVYVPRHGSPTSPEFRAEWGNVPNASVIARRYHTAGWTGREMLIWGGEDGGGGAGNAQNGTAFIPNFDDNGISPYYTLSTGNRPSARRVPGGVWTPLGFVVWGGHDGTAFRRDGKTYVPDGDTWDNLANPPGWPNEDNNGRVVELVWTGRQVIVWGGRGRNAVHGDGKMYDPRSNSWTNMTGAGLTGRAGYATGWTGKHFLVWGGMSTSDVLDDGKLYDPAADSWRDINTANAPSARAFPFCVWTGNRFIIWGGTTSHTNNGPVTDTGFTYDPYDGPTGSWTAMSTQNAPPPMARTYSADSSGLGAGNFRLLTHQPNNAIWTGKEMVVAFGSHGAVAGENPADHQVYAYNPNTDTWRQLTNINLDARIGMSAVWTGQEIITWGGSDRSSAHRNGFRLFVPVELGADFAATPTANAPSARELAAGIDDGQWALIWGGRQTSSVGVDTALNTGAAYHPGLNEWVALSTNSAPSARWGHVALHVGGMLVWGGRDAIGSHTNTGALLDWPTNSGWTAMPTNNAPSGRSFAGACFSGRFVIVFGGQDAVGGRNDGGRYNVRGAGAWSSMASPPAAKFPVTGRVRPIVEWIGPVMISGNVRQVALVWGGYDATTGTPYNSGAFYSPSNDTWYDAVDNGPALRDCMWAWNGRRLIVWSGTDGAVVPNYLQEAWEFNPYATAGNQWQRLSTVDAPSPRQRGGIYDRGADVGGKFHVVGGIEGTTVPTDRAEYDWFLDRWTTLPALSALPNNEHRRARGVELALPEHGRIIFWGGWYNNSQNPRQSARGNTR